MAKLVNNLDHHRLLPVQEEPPLCTTPPSRTAALLTYPSTDDASAKRQPQEFSVERFPLLPSVPLNLPNPSDISAEVHHLSKLATAIHVFKSRFDELQKSFDFIDEAIKLRSSELTQTLNSMPPPVSSTCATFSAINSAQPKEIVTTELGKLKDNNLKSNVEILTDKADPSGDSFVNKVLILACKSMCRRGLRKYIVSHLSDAAKLREQVPLALKFAPKPEKLVLDSVGRFYRQGSKAFTNQNSLARSGRDVSILILECFLLSECAEKTVALDVSVKDEADSAAIAWRKRLIAEGGLSKADQIDARGLLMLVAGFGIPAFFKAEDLTDIIRVSKAREIAHVLRKSHVLRSRIPDVIEGLIKKGLTVDAVDFTYIFGFEEKFCPKTMLTSFLKESEEAWEKARKETNGSYVLLKEANEKYMAALQSVLNCLEGHKIDWMGLLPGWKIKEKIANIMRGVADSSERTEDKVLQKRKVQKIEPSNKLHELETKRSDSSERTEDKVLQKRKVQKIEPSNKLHELETKRSKFIAEGSPLVSPSVTALQYHQAAVNVDGKSLHDDSMPESLSVAGPSSQLQCYPVASSAQMGCAAGSLLEKVHLIDGIGVPATEIGSRSSAGTIVNPKESASAYNKDVELDKLGTPEANRPTSSQLNGNREVVSFNDRYSWQGFDGQPASSRPNSFLGKLPSLDGFPGLLDCRTGGFSNDESSSDLYRFVDAVIESEYNH